MCINIKYQNQRFFQDSQISYDFGSVFLTVIVIINSILVRQRIWVWLIWQIDSTFQIKLTDLCQNCQQQYCDKNTMEMEAVNGDQPKLVISQQAMKGLPQSISQSTQQKTWNKYCVSISKLKISLIAQLIRTSIYILVAWGIFVSYENNTNHIAMHQQSYFSSQKVVYPSQIRGLYPPIQGSSHNLYGKWAVSFTNSRQIGSNDIFSNFTMEFKLNNVLRIKRVGCDGDLILRWQTFEYNIYLSQYTKFNTDTEMIIEPNQTDIQCIKSNTTFFNHLDNASIWTLYQQRLYILIQQWKNGRNAQSILLLEMK